MARMSANAVTACSASGPSARTVKALPAVAPSPITARAPVGLTVRSPCFSCMTLRYDTCASTAAAALTQQTPEDVWHLVQQHCRPQLP